MDNKYFEQYFVNLKNVLKRLGNFEASASHDDFQLLEEIYSNGAVFGNDIACI